MKHSGVKCLAAFLVFAVLLSGMAFSTVAEAHEVDVKITNIWFKGNTINYAVRFTNNGNQKVRVTKLTMRNLSIWDDKGKKFSVEKSAFSNLKLEISPSHYVDDTFQSNVTNVSKKYFSNWGKLGWKSNFSVTFDRLSNRRRTSYDFWAIYDNDNGHIRVFANGDEIRAEFHINKMHVEGSGEINGNEAVLFLDNGEEVNMTFSNFKNRLVETITVKGYRPFNGTYDAYHGHA
ncbi:MAG: hypothetical protein IJQ08_07405 [Synergistaceae bacterium]|nr:hypothetical protein [Synergistaceae bacterium]